MPIACSALAREAGDDRFVSIVALGALIARRPIVSTESIRQALGIVVGDRPALVAADIAAFERGLEAATSALGVPA